jgi:formiminotetrahydrofolate cyclodeaminase
VEDVVTAPSFRDLAIDTFVEQLCSAEPAPGGGAASAVAASLGASLVAMVAGLSQGRERYASHAATHEEAAHVGRELAGRFLTLADEDAAAYAAFAGALKLPRESEEQKAVRSGAIHAAARVAADVPMRTVEACLQLVRAAEALAGRSNRNASSDLTVAALLGEAAARGAAANVIVNLPSVGDEEYADGLRGRVMDLLDEIASLAAQTREVVGSGTEREPLPAHSWR